MRIYLRHENKRRYCIPVPFPLFLIRLVCSNSLKRLILKNLNSEAKKYIEHLDLDALSTAIADIKQYKGLRLVEVSTHKGDEVTIIL